MNLFLSAWFVTADLSSTSAADTFFSSLVKHLVVVFSYRFISFRILLVFFESCSKCYRTFFQSRFPLPVYDAFVPVCRVCDYRLMLYRR